MSLIHSVSFCCHIYVHVMFYVQSWALSCFLLCQSILQSIGLSAIVHVCVPCHFLFVKDVPLYLLFQLSSVSEIVTVRSVFFKLLLLQDQQQCFPLLAHFVLVSLNISGMAESTKASGTMMIVQVADFWNWQNPYCFDLINCLSSVIGCKEPLLLFFIADQLILVIYAEIFVNSLIFLCCDVFFNGFCIYPCTLFIKCLGKGVPFLFNTCGLKLTLENEMNEVALGLVYCLLHCCVLGGFM